CLLQGLEAQSKLRPHVQAEPTGSSCRSPYSRGAVFRSMTHHDVQWRRLDSAEYPSGLQNRAQRLLDSLYFEMLKIQKLCCGFGISVGIRLLWPIWNLLAS